MRFLLRLLLFIALLCNFSGIRLGVGEHGDAHVSCDGCGQISRPSDHLRDVADETQAPLSNIFRLSRTSHRVLSFRPVRLIPSHGGNPGHSQGRWAASADGKTSRNYFLPLCHSQAGLCAAFTSPRFYYVIALRRILC